MSARMLGGVPVRALHCDRIRTLRASADYGANVLFCGDTFVHCGRKHILGRTAFARTVAASKAALAARESDDCARGDADGPARRSAIGRDAATIPFPRGVDPELAAFTGTCFGSPVAAPVRACAPRHARRQAPAGGQKCLTRRASKVRQPADFA